MKKDKIFLLILFEPPDYGNILRLNVVLNIYLIARCKYWQVWFSVLNFQVLKRKEYFFIDVYLK